MSRAPWVVAGVAIVTTAAVGVAAFGLLDRGAATADTTTPKKPKAATAAVERTTLVETKDVDGTLAYPDPEPVNAETPGTVTWLPAVGRTVKRGQTLFRENDRPVFLMYGTLPAYRTLGVGAEGTDVKQLEQNLRALGYTGFDVDDEYTSYTADAVKKWQDDHDLPETGQVELGRIVYADSAVRVAEQKATKGGRAGPGQPVLTIGTPSREVTAQLDVADQNLARKGAKVSIDLPSGRTVDGRITDIGTTATAADNGNGSGDGGSGDSGSGDPSDSTVDVTMSVTDQKALGVLDKAPVKVHFVADEHKDVLAVPVTALLALSEGGYGVELVRGSHHSIAAVRLGAFADGKVEITPDNPDDPAAPKAGDRVEVASS